MSEVIVKELTVYPVKGCQGTSLAEATLTRRGVIGDRLFALVEDGQPLDQIKAPQLGGLGVAALHQPRRVGGHREHHQVAQ